MKPLMFAVLLTVVQAPSPVPGKTSDGTTNPSQKVQKDSSNKQQPSTPAPVENPAPSNASQDAGQRRAEADTQKPIIIREPVPVTIEASWWDRGSVIANMLLVIVGALGVRFALRTLRAIEVQAKAAKESAEAASRTLVALNREIGLMERQTRVMQDSVNVARDSTRGFLYQNRPWLLVEFRDSESRVYAPNYNHNDPSRPAVCAFHIKNYGNSPAKILSIKADLALGSSSTVPPDTEISEEERRSYTEVIPPGESLSQYAKLAIGSLNSKSYGEIYTRAVQSGSHKGDFLWLRGAIAYQQPIDGSPTYMMDFRYVFLKAGWKLFSHTTT